MPFVTSTLRMWLHHWKRFVSIVAITMLGVAVLAGIHAGCQIMFHGANRFYNAQGLYDIQVVSTVGLTEADVNALRDVEGVQSVQPERSAMVSATIGGRSKSLTVSAIGTAGMNRPYLLEGELPSASGQVAVTRSFVKDSGLRVGDTFEVGAESKGGFPGGGIGDTIETSAVPLANGGSEGSPGMRKDAFPQGDDAGQEEGGAQGDSAQRDSALGNITQGDGVQENAGEQSGTGERNDASTLTITGIVLDPQDLSNPDGYAFTQLRTTSTVDYTVFTASQGVTGDVYSAVSVRVRGASEWDTFSQDYDAAVAAVVRRIEDSVQARRQDERHAELASAARGRIDDERELLSQRFAQAQESIDASRTRLSDQLAAMGITDPGARSAAVASDARLSAAQASIDAAQSDLDQRKATAMAALDDQADAAVSGIPEARWYVNTRSSIGSFSSLKSDIGSIDSLGRAFPVLFLVVAVLMTLTTMTRMVEEDRGLIGTYVGLGYGRVAVGMRTVAFAVFACLIGGGVGNLIGYLGIPAFLMVILRGLYVVPGVTLEYDWLYGSMGVLLFVVGVLVATTAAVWREMRHVPAELMRPKVPKAGTRVPLELIGPLWRRMRFLNKVMVRNVFRFKGRLIMTVGGVAGCTALIVCALALNDTVGTLGERQYGGIYRYDMMAVVSDGGIDPLLRRLERDGRSTRILTARVENGTLDTGEGRSARVQMVAVSDAAALSSMVDMRDAGDGKPVTVDDGGVIVSRSAAASLGVEAGSTVSLSGGGPARASVRVEAVSRNLIGTDVYMTTAYYARAFGTGGNAGSAGGDMADAVTLNAVYATLSGSQDERIDYVERLDDDPIVVMAVSAARLRREFRFDLMAAVVVLIVAFAGGLALAVLFTLANTNVSERVREIATLKVLGFFDREVHSYINKEMTLLTVVGVMLGLPLGRVVGGLLTNALNMPGLYFEIDIGWASFAIAAAVTMAFALLVRFATNPVLDRIDPVSSLKSVE